MISLPQMLSQLPPRRSSSLLPQIRAALSESGRKIFVLDDDPTGTQTVYGVTVLTEWPLDALAAALRDPNPVTYILTNSRSLPREGAVALNLEIAANLKAAQAQVNRPFDVISRSDSTLRGHFPAEIDALRQGLGLQPDGILIVPFFKEGGRYTINDVHYVAEGSTLVPAAETEYARDAYFGYTHSDLRDWVIEKCGGAVGKILSLSLEDIRLGGVDAVYQRLLSTSDGAYIVVNAADYSDLEVVALALLQASEKGKTFLARTAASYVRVIGGLDSRSLLSSDELVSPQWRRKPGLVVAGSYIRKSTLQIEAAIQLPQTKPVEVSVNHLLDPSTREAEMQRAAAQVDSGLTAGEDVVLYTSRALVTGSTQEASLEVGRVVSAALVDIVKAVTVRPSWIIAKGGITSSDIATRALQVRAALVLGQILPGVPAWKTGEESRFPGLTYVVFPGNVGNQDSIAQAITLLRCSSL